jgi:hypothetical protein
VCSFTHEASLADGLKSNDRLHKGRATSQGYIFPIPSWNPCGTLVFEVLEVSSPETPNRKRKAKIPQRKRCPSCRDTLKHIVKVNIMASNGNNGALVEVCIKAGDVTKTLKNHRKVLDILLYGSHKNGRIVDTSQTYL